ncbi:hypothetical protein [Planktothrix agardhii]|jgi:hypothetical protein|uniref:Uncharacterized protein n=2 Tax=Planktothrix agardhii TaxID=1160 RepID=A0AAD1V476_PLAAG|nr:hypothetical protein [Planktothrix agardhii]AQY60564.1 hypothetical protein [Planktothrix agardhii No66]MCB8749671.1 hypothetical protein [Planktothrix agardhii 1810]MCB8758425.1 hypothetical protein [Planktothrix agardhii 1813]CAD5914779.1 hypothetical protein PANO66_00290 [Planktothrix agardhii]
MTDLDGLEITPGELKHWSGINENLLYRPGTAKKLIGEGLKTLVIAGLLLISYWIWSLIFPELALIFIIIYLILIILLVLEDMIKIWLTLNRPQCVKLLNQIDNYNSIVKALNIYHQIEATEHPQAKLDNQDAIIHALKLIRIELIRGLKIERILKKNKKFIEKNPELFDLNFTSLTVLQTEKPTTEQGRLLYQAFEIASEVHQLLKQLQD